MNLLVERLDGKWVEYLNADKSRIVIEFMENNKRETVIYYPEDFLKIEAVKVGVKKTSSDEDITAVIAAIKSSIATSAFYGDRYIREFYRRDMAAIRSMLEGLKGGTVNAAE